MTLQLHTASRVERLVEVLAALPPLDPVDPFEPETLVLQTRGMERWLGQELARHRGVFAHARFLSIEDLLAELCDAVAPLEQRDPWRPGRLVWPVAELLREADGRPGALGSWLASTRAGPASHALQHGEARPEALPDQVIQLAWRIADVFHRYAIYRPDMVAGWEGGAELEGRGAWQPELWRALAARLAVPNPGRRLRALISRLTAPPEPGLVGTEALALPSRRVVLFGYHTLAPLQLEAIEALSRQVDVHLMRVRIGATALPRPSGPNAAPHPLRKSLGRLGDDLDALLLDLAPNAPRHDHLEAPDRSSLLGRLQSAIHFGAAQPEATSLGRIDELSARDRSLQFHSCSSELRQVEVLRDELLQLLVERPELEPRDVVVMTPDIETYAPLVDAVFRDGDPDLPETDPRSAGFPPIHRLYDRSLRRTNPLAEGFLALLELVGSRYPLPGVLELMALPPMLKKAGLEEEDLTRIQELLVQAGVRWGVDEQHRQAHAQPRARQNTWAAGFDRLLLGHAMASLGVESFHDVVPVDDVEGKEVETLGRFIDYVERLFSELADLAAPRTVPEWRLRLVALTERLLVSDDDSAGLAQPIYDELQALTDRAEGGGFCGRLELGAVLGLLRAPFEARRPSMSFLSGGLTFCSLVPMRTIPFAVICLLGMDSGKFPRSPHGLGFDLLDTAPGVGDRNAREDDRMTFLETVMAARHHLIVTWTGYRATDKRELDAAGPVAELMETVRRSFERSDSRGGLDGLDGPARELERLPPPVLVRHPLQPFTPSNFELSAPGSFDLRYLRGARRLVAPRIELAPHWRQGPPPTSFPREVDLADLVLCLEKPALWFCRQRLGVQLNEYGAPLREREPIALDQLERWELRDRVLRWELANVDPRERERVLLASGHLPIGAAGRLELVEIEAGVRQIAQRVRRLAPVPATSVPIELHLGGFSIVGVVDEVHHLPGAGAAAESHLVRYKAGHLKEADTLALWVEHLALAAALRHRVTSHFVGHEGHGSLRPVAPAEARERLFELASLWLAGLRQPLSLFPATSWAWLDWHESTAGADELPSRLVDVWHKQGQTSMGDATDVHVQLLFSHRLRDADFPFHDEAFQTTARLVLDPLRRAWHRESLA